MSKMEFSIARIRELEKELKDLREKVPCFNPGINEKYWCITSDVQTGLPISMGPYVANSSSVVRGVFRTREKCQEFCEVLRCYLMELSGNNN